MRIKQMSDLKPSHRDEKRGADPHARTFVPMGLAGMPGILVYQGKRLPQAQLTCPAGSLLLAGAPVLVAESLAEEDSLDEDLSILASLNDEDDMDELEDLDDKDDDLEDSDDEDEDVDDEDWEDEFEDDDDDDDEDEDDLDDDDDDEF